LSESIRHLSMPEPTFPDDVPRERPNMGDADRNWLHAVLRGVAEAVVLADPRDRVTAMNPAAEMLTGWREADAVGRELDDVLPGLAAACRGSADGERPVPFRSLDGRDLRVQVSAVEVQADGGSTGRVITLRAVEDEDRLERFARKISHDLRSPIHAVVMMAELLVEDAGPLLPQDQQVLLQRIIERVRGLDGQEISRQR
jgi:PAS domain S-box-containing protein